MKIRLCPKCGKQNDENAWNCTDCGTTLSLKTLIDTDSIQKSGTHMSGNKIKLCPKCGKQNDENAWNCVDCGTTLSVNTLVDASEVETSQVDLVRKRVLFGISRYFQSDYDALLDKVVQDGESVVWGCNIAAHSRLPLPPFLFGYVILTSHRLFTVYFESDTKIGLNGVLPQRSIVDQEFVLRELNQRSSTIIMVKPPEYGLTGEEQSSRRLSILFLKDLYYVGLSGENRLVEDLYGANLYLKFRKGDGISLDDFTITFYSDAEVSEIYMPLREKLIK